MKRNAYFALFALGFRPFFLLAGLGSVGLMAAWLGVWRGAMPAPWGYDAVLWHGHEMIFGYAAAVIAGFLLTAVANWTGLATLRGAPLALLAGVWVLGRLSPLAPGEAFAWTSAVLDLAFLPWLAAAIAVPLLRSGNRRNLIFVGVLGILIAANLMFQGERLGLARGTAADGIRLSLYAVVLLVSVLGGRVIPFFIERALPGGHTRRRRTLEVLAPISLVVVAAMDLAGATPAVLAVAAGVAAAAHAARLAGWHDARLWRVPLLWVLYLGYAWLAAGLVLLVLQQLGHASPFIVTHAFTAGTIGVMSLGMMARVTLGHTGRDLRADRTTAAIFVLVNAAAFLRVLVPWAAPAWQTASVTAAGWTWVAAYALFVIRYAPVLVRPRADARPD